MCTGEYCIVNCMNSIPWHVYIVRCADGTYYTGVTNDVTRRTAQHSEGTGARYTRGRGPVELVYAEQVIDRSTALTREVAIKRLTHKQKVALIQTSATQMSNQ